MHRKTAGPRLGFLLLVGAYVAAAGCVGDEPGPATAANDAGQDASTPSDAGGDGGGDDGNDGSVDADATVLACDLTKEFGTPLLVPGVNTTAIEDSARLSQDELTIYWNSDRAEAGADYDLYFATRPSRTSSFGPASRLANVNTDVYELCPTVTADGLTLVFTRSKGGGDPFQLYLATRSAPAQDFGAAATVSGVNSSGEFTPFFLADGSELWFSSNRNTANDYDIYVASKVGQSFSNPLPQPELNTVSIDEAPVLSEDGLTIYWASDRADGNAKGGYDIWTAKRSTKEQQFSGIKTVAELNTPEGEVPTWLSKDGCRLYFEGYRSGARDLYVAERSK